MIDIGGEDRFKASETLLGIETMAITGIVTATDWFKASETLLGIETARKHENGSRWNRFKASETLLGIETALTRLSNSDAWKIQSLWNPFRDWNKVALYLASQSCQDSKPLKPF